MTTVKHNEQRCQLGNPLKYFWEVAVLLMEEILHQLVGSLSHYLQGFQKSQVVVWEWDFWTISSMFNDLGN